MKLIAFVLYFTNLLTKGLIQMFKIFPTHNMIYEMCAVYFYDKKTLWCRKIWFLYFVSKSYVFYEFSYTTSTLL